DQDIAEEALGLLVRYTFGQGCDHLLFLAYLSLDFGYRRINRNAMKESNVFKNNKPDDYSMRVIVQ
nr:hypothetical protein [Tanacetum cinerariifolium]